MEICWDIKGSRTDSVADFMPYVPSLHFQHLVGCFLVMTSKSIIVPPWLKNILLHAAPLHSETQKWLGTTLSNVEKNLIEEFWTTWLHTSQQKWPGGPNVLIASLSMTTASRKICHPCYSIPLLRDLQRMPSILSHLWRRLLHWNWHARIYLELAYAHPSVSQ